MLAGGHLLILPTLADKAGSLTSQTDGNLKQLAVLLEYRKDAVNQFGGIEYLLEDYLAQRGIARDNKPLAYSLSVENYEETCKYLAEDEVQIRRDQKENYIGLFFVSETFTEDLGEHLEEIEHANPGLGDWLLDRFNLSPCNILTPAKIYHEADFLLGWDRADGDEPGYLDDDQESITPEKFKEYFPDWAYKRFNDPPPDFSRWEQLTALHDREQDFFCAESITNRKDDRNLIIPEGADMYAGAIAWTKDRNEIERDISYRVCNDLYHDMLYANGANPGCMQFEFIMDEENADRNLRIADLLDKFIRYLAVLDRVITDIGKGEFR